MRVQNICQNNYNCSNRHNSNSQPAFKASILCTFARRFNKDVPDAAGIEQSKLTGTVLNLLRKCGVELPSDMLGGTILSVRSSNKKVGAIMVVDRSTPHMKEALADLPFDVETKLDQPDVQIDVYNMAVKDPVTVKYIAWLEDIEDYSNRENGLRIS